MFYSLGLYNIHKKIFNNKISYWRLIKNPLKLNIPFARSDFLFARTKKMEYTFFLYMVTSYIFINGYLDTFYHQNTNS